MSLTSLARSANAVAHALHHRSRPQPKMDPYTVWMMHNLPGVREWHR